MNFGGKPSPAVAVLDAPAVDVTAYLVGWLWTHASLDSFLILASWHRTTASQFGYATTGCAGGQAHMWFPFRINI